MSTLLLLHNKHLAKCTSYKSNEFARMAAQQSFTGEQLPKMTQEFNGSDGHISGKPEQVSKEWYHYRVSVIVFLVIIGGPINFS